MKQWLQMQVAQDLRTVEFGDKRLVKRCIKLGKAMAKQSDGSIPSFSGKWKEAKAAYRFYANPKVKRRAILKAHQKATLERMRQESSEVLMIQDTSVLDLSRHHAMEGRGPIGKERHMQGLLMHNAFAVSISGDVLGLLDQRVWSRRQRSYPKTETGLQRRQRERESQRWQRVLKTIRKQTQAAVIHVADREADIYELLEELVGHGERFVIRSSWNRRLEETGQLISDALKQAPEVGFVELELPARGGKAKSKAYLRICRTSVTIRPPKTMPAGHPNITVGIVEAFEQGQEGLHWRLLTTEPIETLEDCLRVLQIYSRRWRIEEFHKGLKTGCQVEERRLETAKRLGVFLIMASVITTFLLRIRHLAQQGEELANDYFSLEQIAILRKKFPGLLGRQPAVAQALRAMAQLGGFLGRKGDGDPGWITLWRGWKKLIQLEEGLHMAKSILYPRPSIPTCG